MDNTLKPPKHLAKSTAAWWSDTVAAFSLEQHHIRLLTLAAQSWDRAEQARVLLEQHGLTFENASGEPRTRPEVAIERDNRIAFARLVRECGFDLGEAVPPQSPDIGHNAGLRYG